MRAPIPDTIVSVRGEPRNTSGVRTGPQYPMRELPLRSSCPAKPDGPPILLKCNRLAFRISECSPPVSSQAGHGRQ